MKTKQLLALSLGLSSAYALGTNFMQATQPELLLSKDESFHFELLVPLGQATHGGADIGPVLGAAKSIEPGNFSSFSDAFYKLANETKALALEPRNAYDPINVRDTWFSAATYFRRADFYLHGNPDNPLIDTLWDEQTAAFDKAIAALPVPGQRLQIPADNFTIEAIWYAVANDNVRRPTLILGNGYDEAQEDLYHTIVVPAIARGWNCITYEGPGQPLVRRKQNLGFIPDWERVVTPVVDYLLAQQQDAVNCDRLVLFGYSLGGYLAARAAAFEPRLSAVVLDGGIFDVYEVYTASLPSEAHSLLEANNRTAFDAYMSAVLASPEAPSSVRWALEQGLWSFKTRSVYDFFQQCKAYTLEGVVGKISMPVWTADAEYESFFPGQSRRVKDALGERATYHLFEGSAGYHCQVGAVQELVRSMFAWLGEALG